VSGHGRRQTANGRRLAAFCVVAVCLLPSAFVSGEAAAVQPGLTAATEVARAYDTILDTAFERLPEQLSTTCPPAPRVTCTGLEALGIWWQIVLDPESRALDAAFAAKAEAAIAEARAFTAAEPERAEAWFYLGAAYGVRGQLRVLREQRLAAARDGKAIKEALERALALDPAMDDAAFGVGMYRYYAAVAPAVFRMMRWLFLLPGGNRTEGLQQLERASQRGRLVRSEAIYQTLIIYFWYEHKPKEALQMLRDLQARYPHNLHFRQLEAEVLDVYLHDRQASLQASQDLLALAAGRQVYRADIAEVRARLNMASQWRALGQRDRALDELNTIIKLSPSAPAGALARARAMHQAITRR
jgi:tetratricopeptide (TPR) repeat protein